MRVSSGFWAGLELPSAVEAGLRQFYDGSTTAPRRAESLEPLFEDPRVEIRGVALDAYSELLPNARHGGESLIEALEPAARMCAVRELLDTPYLPAGVAVFRRGANHGSAFRSMWAFVVRGDAPVLAKALSENEDPRVLAAGLGAASGALFEVEHADDKLAAVVVSIARDGNASRDVRVEAIRAAGASRDPAFEPLFIGLLQDASVDVRSASARALLKRDKGRYREVVEPLIKTWPSDPLAPYDLVEARRLLADDDDDGWA